MEIPYLLRQLGFSDREIKVYLSLMSRGSLSVRKLAKETELNRGSVYEALKSLRDMGLVGVYQKHKKQFYLPEDPEKLMEVVERREQGILNLKRRVGEVLPELRSLHSSGREGPAVKYYEGLKGVNIILKDVLTTMSELPSGDRLYRVFSSPHLRQFIYSNFPTFTKDRIARDIRARVLVIGQGSEERPLVEQRRIPGRSESAPTYSFIYGSKVAFVSLDESESPIGVLVEDERIAETQRIVFDHVWGVSPSDSRVATEATIAENL
ncbi:TrmB family transcriptional regulator [Patescibacteria group bacterium]